MKAFITGSRAYGKPRNDSDIDLVVLVSEEDASLLRRMSDDPAWAKVTYGQLNLIVLNADDPADVDRYNAWKKGTDQLKARKPVTKTEAIALLHALGTENSGYGTY